MEGLICPKNTHNIVSTVPSPSVNNSAISTATAVILTAIIVGSVVGGAVYAYFALQSAPAQQLVTQPKPALEKIKVSAQALVGGIRLEAVFLMVDAANDRRIWANNGLDPEFATGQGGQVSATGIKTHVESGIKIGINGASDTLLARAAGVPIKIVAGYTGVPSQTMYVKADSPTKTVKDLDGKKVGVNTLGDAPTTHISYLSKKFGISIEAVPLVNDTNKLVGLKLGKIDAFWSPSGAFFRLVDSGELRVLVKLSDFHPVPAVSWVIWATDDIIEQNPDLVRRFVKAVLESVKYLKENPSYAVELHMKNTNAFRELAEKAAAQVSWTPSGRGTDQDLVAAVTNVWQYVKDSGGLPANIAPVKAEDAVDIRFLP